MKKNLLTISLISLVVPLNAQFITSIGDKALVSVKSDALVYNGGSLKTKGSGVLDISGNVIVSGGASNTLQTMDAANSNAKNDGGNIILRLTETDNSRYGQLAILGLPNSNISGVVSKEYRDRSHGSYQQIAMPFKDKTMAGLAIELDKTISNIRHSQDEVLNNNNSKVRSDVFLNTTPTSNPVEYYMLGASKGAWSSESNTDSETNPNTAINGFGSTNYTPGTYVITGKPYSDQSGTSVTLTGAGAGIDFGTSGQNVNLYREKYNSYLQDAWDYAKGQWKLNYGRNIYQFGNPFLTNLDLSQIAVTEVNGDGNNLVNILGIRVDPGDVVTTSSGSTYSTGAKFVTFNSGVATGDVNASIIKPMQTFVVKLSSNSPASLDFNTLRRFKYTERSGAYTGPASAKNNSTVKQLGVIALDANGNEMGRCYYVVYANGKSGRPLNVSSTQVINSNTNVIGTFEENATTGGYDSALTGQYWLYINEANEEDFKGKSIPMNLYNNNIKSLKFEIRENAQLLADGQQELSTGKEFYFNIGNQDLVPIKNGQVVDVTSSEYGLFYDKSEAVLGGNDVAKPSRTKVAYSSNIDDYVVVFDPEWKQADVKVYDASGKLILSKNKVSTKSELVLNIQKTNGIYVVVATSEKGEVVNTKIIR